MMIIIIKRVFTEKNESVHDRFTLNVSILILSKTHEKPVANPITRHYGPEQPRIQI